MNACSEAFQWIRNFPIFQLDELRNAYTNTITMHFCFIYLWIAMNACSNSSISQYTCKIKNRTLTTNVLQSECMRNLNITRIKWQFAFTHLKCGFGLRMHDCCVLSNQFSCSRFSFDAKERTRNINFPFFNIVYCIWNGIKISDNIVVLIFSIFNSFIFVVFRNFNICLLKLTVKRRLSFIFTAIVALKWYSN